jgi:hypothetical protein
METFLTSYMTVRFHWFRYLYVVRNNRQGSTGFCISHSSLHVKVSLVLFVQEFVSHTNPSRLRKFLDLRCLTAERAVVCRKVSAVCSAVSWQGWRRTGRTFVATHHCIHTAHTCNIALHWLLQFPNPILYPYICNPLRAFTSITVRLRVG